MYTLTHPQTLDKMLHFLHRPDIRFPSVSQGQTLVDRVEDTTYFTDTPKIRELLFKSGFIEEPNGEEFDLHETLRTLQAATFFKTTSGWVAKTLVAKDVEGQLHWYSHSLVSHVDCVDDNEPRDEWDTAIQKLAHVLPENVSPTLHFPLSCPRHLSPESRFEGISQPVVCMLLLMSCVYESECTINKDTETRLRKTLSNIRLPGS